VAGDKSANERLRDLAILRAHALERLKAGETIRALAFLRDEVNPLLRSLLADRLSLIEERGRDIGPATTARLETMSREIEATIAAGYAKIVDDQVRGRLPRIGKLETEWQVESLRASIPDELARMDPVRFSFSLASPETVARIVETQPLAMGRSITGFWDRASASYAAKAHDVVRAGVVAGQSSSEITRRVMSGIGSPASRAAADAESIVRTSVNHVSTEVREETWKANDDIVKGVIYIATLDTSTTYVCRSLDGQVFPIDKGPRPPQHFNCRSTTSVVLKSLRELGIGKSEAESLSKATRASMNGQVPASTRYYDWLRDQDERVQDLALGKRRADLWRSGAVSDSDLVDFRGRPVSIEKLEKGLED
jgi:SPP1 gp7 family putative phage head morphogenesis protein